MRTWISVASFILIASGRECKWTQNERRNYARPWPWLVPYWLWYNLTKSIQGRREHVHVQRKEWINAVRDNARDAVRCGERSITDCFLLQMSNQAPPPPPPYSSGPPPQYEGHLPPINQPREPRPVRAALVCFLGIDRWKRKVSFFSRNHSTGFQRRSGLKVNWTQWTLVGFLE